MTLAQVSPTHPLADDQNTILLPAVPCDRMFADMAYARPISARKVEEMKNTWNPKGAGVVYLSMRNDAGAERYAILDGAHRQAACMWHHREQGGIATLAARIYIDLTIEEEARLFAIYNGKRNNPKPLDVFRARITAREPKALAVLAVLHGAGLDVNYETKLHAGRVSAMATLEEIYDSMGARLLGDTLRTAVVCFGNHDKHGLSGPVLQGIARFLVRYQRDPDFKPERLVDRLQLTGSAILIGKANGLKASRPGMDLGTAVGRVMLDLYNLGRGKRLSEWAEKAVTEAALAAVGPRVQRAAETRKRLGATRSQYSPPRPVEAGAITTTDPLLLQARFSAR